MPEPTASAAAAATLASQAVALPALTLFGLALGLQADVLLAGFCGAVAAMTLLNSVPASGDTWVELLRTSARRVGVAIGSALTAGYTAPLLQLQVWQGLVPPALILSAAFVVGAGAMQILPGLIERFGKVAPGKGKGGRS